MGNGMECRYGCCCFESGEQRKCRKAPSSECNREIRKPLAEHRLLRTPARLRSYVHAMCGVDSVRFH